MLKNNTQFIEKIKDFNFDSFTSLFNTVLWNEPKKEFMQAVEKIVQDAKEEVEKSKISYSKSTLPVRNLEQSKIKDFVDKYLTIYDYL